MEYLKDLFLGMVQGLSEFLPISSSGHLKLFQHLFGLQENDLFVSVMLHLGTLVAVVLVYRKTIWEMIREFFAMIGDIAHRRFSFNHMNPRRRMMVMILISTLVLILLVIPLGEHSVKDYIEMLNESESLVPLALAFMVTGAVLLITFRVSKRGTGGRKNPKVKDALIIGGAQCVATISGISRSGSTMSAGVLCGLSRQYMVQYSFIMSIPVILAAAASDAKDALKGEIAVAVGPLLLGIVSAMIFGIFSIKMIQWLIRRDRYNVFGYYCAGLGVLTLILALFGI